jgi:hypothetical protein
MYDGTVEKNQIAAEGEKKERSNILYEFTHPCHSQCPASENLRSIYNQKVNQSAIMGLQNQVHPLQFHGHIETHI